MKKIFVILFLATCVTCPAPAQLPAVSVITTLVKKVINAIDLEVENLQDQTMVLQNAQKALENTMSGYQLTGIGSWVSQMKDLYSNYYTELSQVKQIIADYDKVKTIISQQERIVAEYQSSYALFKQDKNFSSSEISYMYTVYSGILNESLKDVEQVLLVVNAFVTQMSDGARMNIINGASVSMQQHYNDLKQFSNQNIQLSLQRGAENNDLGTVKKLYGLP